MYPIHFNPNFWRQWLKGKHHKIIIKDRQKNIIQVCDDVISVLFALSLPTNIPTPRRVVQQSTIIHSISTNRWMMLLYCRTHKKAKKCKTQLTKNQKYWARWSNITKWCDGLVFITSHFYFYLPFRCHALLLLLLLSVPLCTSLALHIISHCISA